MTHGWASIGEGDISRLQQGDSAAWQRFYAVFRPLVEHHVQCFLEERDLPRHLADDLVQDCFLFIWWRIKNARDVLWVRRCDRRGRVMGLAPAVTRWTQQCLARYARGKRRAFNDAMLSIEEITNARAVRHSRHGRHT